jgi:uncharacterized protein Veg
MREIKQDIPGTIDKLRQIKGLNIRLRVNRGRNRIEELEGMIENTYPSIFTLRTAGGEIFTFSYADVINRNILFYRKQSTDI